MILYHGFHEEIPTLPAPFEGSNREDLSVLLGGKVGFAYGYLPDSWQKLNNVVMVEIPDDELVVVATVDYPDSYGQIPRRSERDNWDKHCKIVKAVETLQYKNEVAFNTCNAVIVAKLQK